MNICMGLAGFSTCNKVKNRCSRHCSKLNKIVKWHLQTNRANGINTIILEDVVVQRFPYGILKYS